MPLDSIENAEELIKQSKQVEARDLLESLLTADPHNLPAWASYLKTYTTDQERVKVLDLCLKYNPDSKDAIQALKNHLALPGQRETPLPHKANPGKNVKEVFLSIIPIILYGLAVAGIVAEIRFFKDLSSSPTWQGGFGELAIVFFWIAFLGIQWIILNAIVSLYTLRKRREKSVKQWVQGMGTLAGSVAVIYIMIPIFRSSSILELTSLVIGILEIAPFVFIFGFVCGSGLVSLLILIIDAIVNTVELFVDSTV